MVLFEIVMSKGSGGTRGSSWRDKKKVSNLEQQTNDILHLQESIRSGRFTDGWSPEKQARNTWEQISEKERLAALEGGRYTGMVQGDDLEYASFYKEITKNEMVRTLQDELMNASEGFDMTDTNHYIIKIKGQKAFNSAEHNKMLTKAQVRDIEWISADQGLSNYSYYAKDAKAKQNMMHHMEFHEFKKGYDLSGYFADKYYSYEEQFWHD